MRDPHLLALPVAGLVLAWTTSAAPAPFVYVGNYGDGTVSVIDAATNDVQATVPVGSHPLGVAVDPLGTTVYVTDQVPAGVVSILDAASNKVVTTVPVGVGPSGVAVKLPGTKVYVANRDDKTVSVLDAATNEVVATIPVGKNPLGVAVSPAGTPAYVVNKGSDDVSVIDTNTDQVIGTIPVGNDPSHVAVSPDGSRVYVTNGGTANVSVIDTGSNTVVDTIEVGSKPAGVAFDPAGARAYVANNGPDTVSVVDTTSNTVITTVHVGTSPFDLTVDPTGARVYVTNRGGGDVSVIDVATNGLIDTIDVGLGPVGFGSLMRPALRPPLFTKAALACQNEIAKRGRKLASADQKGQSTCRNRLLAAVAAGTGTQEAEVACAQVAAAASAARASAIASIGGRCKGLAPAAINRPCSRLAATIAETADCVLGQCDARVGQMIAAEFAAGGQPLDKAERNCQAAIAGAGRKLADTAQAQLAACLTGLLKSVASGKNNAGAAGACQRGLDLRNPGSTLAKARAKAETDIGKKCKDVAPADVGSPCDPAATTMVQAAACIVDQHLGRVAQMIAAQFNDACPMLTGVGLGKNFPAVCAGP